MSASQAPGVHVRRARRDDLGRIWEMVAALAEYERLTHELQGTEAKLGEDLFGPHPRIEGLVAEVDGALVGYALFYPTYSSFHTARSMWLEDLFVEPAARGRGAGRALLAGVADVALERGCERVGWIVLDWNEPSIRFYESLGARRGHADWLQYGLDQPAMRALAGP